MIHESATDEAEEYAASYALGSLDDSERDEFDQHIQSCRVCARLVGEFAVSSDAIAESLEPVEASGGLKSRVIQAAVVSLRRPEASESSPIAPIPSEPAAKASWFDSVFGSRGRAIAAAAAVIVIAALIGWNVALQLSDDGDTNAQFASAVHLYDLAGTEAAPGASGSLFRANADRGFLVLRDLPDPGPGNVYQAWRIIGEEAIPEHTFTIDDAPGAALVAVNFNVLDADTIGVNIEPRGGSSVPTNPVLLMKAS